MMETIFTKNEFELCDVPVPYGYKQSQTHSGVAICNGKYYLTTSPYPSGSEAKWKLYLRAALGKIGLNIRSFIPEQWENPCLYIENRIANEIIPRHFSLMQSTPLMPPPDPYYGLPAFNSDPDIFIEGDIIHVLNRQTYRTKICPGEPLNKYSNRIYHIYGRIDRGRFYYLGTELLLETNRLVCSPCLTRYDGKYVLMELETNTYNEGGNFQGLFITYGDSIEDFKNTRKWQRVEIESDFYLPWHMSVFSFEGTLYTIIACVEKGVKQRLWQMLGEFNNDLTSLKVYSTPLTDYNSYRGAALVNENKEFVLYNTTVHEKINGSKSVDGREVILAHAPFDQVLKRLRENGE